MTDTVETPVLIVGAGPVGLAPALDLGWRGVECLLVGEGSGVVEHSKIGHIAVRTMAFFRRWGIALEVREAGFPDDFRMSRVVCSDVSALRKSVAKLLTLGCVGVRYAHREPTLCRV